MIAEKPVVREEVPAVVAPDEGVAPAGAFLTVEVALYGLLILASAALRLYGLGHMPLSADEAGGALAALRAYQGQQTEFGGLSPLVFHLTTLAFWLFSASDATARVVPALFGVVLTGLTYFLRPWLGRLGALLAGVFVALSPSLLFFSRTLGGEVPAVTCSLAFLIALFHSIDARDRRALYVAAGALGLALTAGVATYTVLILLLTFGLLIGLTLRFAGGSVQRRPERPGDGVGSEMASADSHAIEASDNGAGDGDLLVAMVETADDEVRDGQVEADEVPRPAGLPADRRTLGVAGAVLVATFLAASTGLLTNFAGVQSSLNLFSRWAAQFASVNPAIPWSYYLVVLVAYELLALVFGLAGVLAPAPRRSLFHLFLVYWFGGALLLATLAGAKLPAMAVVIVLPLALLAGDAVARLLRWLQAQASAVPEAVFLAVCLPVVGYLLLQYANATNGPATQSRLNIVVAVSLLIFLVGLFWAWWGRDVEARGLGLVALLTALGLGVHAAWNANYFLDREPRELLAPAATAGDVRTLVSTLERYSESKVNDRYGVGVTVEASLSPLLDWYLRDFRQVNIVRSLAGPPSTQAAVVPMTQTLPPLGNLIGQKFRFRSNWQPSLLHASDFARWYFYRQLAQPVAPREVILFVTR